MPSLPSWFPSKAASEPVPGSAPLPAATYYPRNQDPNAPDHRLQITSKCIYERGMPGGSYITAHVERLQSGYYDSPTIHEDCINNVRFVAIRFVFHEASTERRFKSARIRIGVHDEQLKAEGIVPLPPQFNHPANYEPPQEKPRQQPKFLRHAPHLLYGAMSPETLDWNFNLAGSLGVAQTPVSASINPSGGVKSSYKVYKMMKVQGSIRTNSSWFGKHYDVEDGELVWTLEENELQKSGLPREFTFVMMLTKGDSANDVRFELDVEPEVASWFGHYPQWWVHILKYQPLYKEPLDLDTDIGQKFEPCDSHLGFNFAGLMSTFDDFVTLPGTLYSNNDWSGSQAPAPATKQGGDQSKQQQQQPQAQASALTQSPAPLGGQNQETPSNTLHVRIHLGDPPKQGNSVSATYPYPDLGSRSHRLPPAPGTSSPKPASKAVANPNPNPNPPSGNPNKDSRRITINGSVASVPSKYKVPRITPLQTHHEEPQHHKIRTKTSSDEESSDHGHVYSFPEYLSSPPQHPSQPTASSSDHRQTKSISTASSAAVPGPQSSPAISQTRGTQALTANTPLASLPSLRRTRSRSGLRSTSLTSQPEDEEAISAAMDMLSGSPPPPPAPAPPASAPPVITIPSDDVVLATPRTRAALADLLEVERAEKARVERRNGNLNTEISRPARDHSVGPGPSSGQLMSRSREREKAREKRYSMPVTSTGIGYPSTSGSFSARDRSSSIVGGSSGGGGKSNDASSAEGNGRSSLMIPIGSKRDSGLGIGIATTTPGANNINNINTGTGGERSGSFKRDKNSGVYSGYEYVG